MNAEELPQTAHVRLSLPADASYAQVLRTTTAAVAARAELTLDDLEDLKIAVTEALALLMTVALPLQELSIDYRLEPGSVEVRLQVPAAAARLDEDSFAWQVLTALSERARLDEGNGLAGITLAVRSALVV